MPRSDFDAKAFLDEMFQAAGELPPEKRALAEELFSVDGVKNFVADHSLRKQDYSRLAQTSVQEKKAYESRNKELNDWYQQQLLVVKQNQEEYEKMQKQLEGYRSEYGEMNVGGHKPNAPTIDPDMFIPKKAHDEEIARLRQAVAGTQTEGISLIAEATTLLGRHLHEFKEPLDVVSLTQQAIEQKIPLKVAYDQMVAERRQAVADADMKSRLDAAREEGRRSAMSGMKIPAVMPTEIHPLEARAKLGDKINMPAWQLGVQDYVSGEYDKGASK